MPLERTDSGFDITNAIHGGLAMKACFSIILAVMIFGTFLFSSVSANASGLAEAVFYVK
jgi:hypothetical protein